MSRVVRFQVEVTEEQSKSLDELARQVGLRTKKELFNNALTLFKWAVKERRKGRIICSVGSNDSIKELEMPVLDAAGLASPFSC
jgi:hypothetical protein